MAGHPVLTSGPTVTPGSLTVVNRGPALPSRAADPGLQGAPRAIGRAALRLLRRARRAPPNHTEPASRPVSPGRLTAPGLRSRPREAPPSEPAERPLPSAEPRPLARRHPRAGSSDGPSRPPLRALPALLLRQPRPLGEALGEGREQQRLDWPPPPDAIGSVPSRAALGSPPAGRVRGRVGREAPGESRKRFRAVVKRRSLESATWFDLQRADPGSSPKTAPRRGAGALGRPLRGGKGEGRLSQSARDPPLASPPLRSAEPGRAGPRVRPF